MGFRDNMGKCKPCQPTFQVPPVKPLIHPSVDDITVEGILHALSDPVRVDIFSRIASAGCPQTCTALDESGGKPVPKSTLSQHFKALRDAGLIRSERKG